MTETTYMFSTTLISSEKNGDKISGATMSSSRISPVQFLRELMPDNVSRRRFRSSDLAIPPSEDRTRHYDMISVQAIRGNNIEVLRELLQDGKSFNACNRNGETLLHLACRRSNIDTVHFLVNDAAVDVNVQDDMGRTPLHDICWRPRPDFALMEKLMLVISPELLLVEDSRGHTCMDYVRKEHWEEWLSFLRIHATTIRRRAKLYYGVRSSLQ